MAEQRLDTAHEYWDRWWGNAKGRAKWSDPEPVVCAYIAELKDRGAHRVLDVGTGIGRHALAYSREGFEVVAIDASSTGLEEVTKAAVELGLAVDVRQAPFTGLPLDDGSIDHVLAWNVLYHGDDGIVSKAFCECRRVLSDGGTFQLTLLSKRNAAYGAGKEVKPDTFVDESSVGDKDHPHFYVDALGAARMLSETGFEILSLEDSDQNPPGGFHWVVLAEARSPRSLL